MSRNSAVLDRFDGYLNAAAFVPPPAIGSEGSLGFGNVGFGTLLGPGQSNWDMSLEKTTTVGRTRENATLQFRAEFFNVFNHPQFSEPDTNVPDGSFGQITTSAVNPRVIQFALKYVF